MVTIRIPARANSGTGPQRSPSVEVVDTNAAPPPIPQEADVGPLRAPSPPPPSRTFTVPSTWWLANPAWIGTLYISPRSHIIWLILLPPTDGAVNPPVYYLDHFDIADGIQAALDAGVPVPATTVAGHGYAALEARKFPSTLTHGIIFMLLC